MNIVIMGATSHIAKGLIHRFLQRGEDHLFLYSRSADRVSNFLDSIGRAGNGSCTVCTDYSDFASLPYDVIVNCIGVETRNKHNCDFIRYFTVTEKFDDLAIGYLQNRNPDAIYISFSSGAVYGRGFSTPAADDSFNCIHVNNVVQEDYYGIARINAEAKHRAHRNLRIIDLRVFAYFSRYINLRDGYFITDLLQAVLENKVLVTDTRNFVRDYLHPEDLFSMIQQCIRTGRTNRAFDVNSSRPASKQEILDYFSSEYRLKYERRSFSTNHSATGTKNNYYSIRSGASQIGYSPLFSSIDALKDEAKHILISKPMPLKEAFEAR